MSAKYKVHAEDQFLGHYQAQDALSAIEKAIEANFNYHPEILGMPDCIFTSKKGILGKTYMYSWENLPHIVDKFEIPKEDAA